jgi:hypothetical protein
MIFIKMQIQFKIAQINKNIYYTKLYIYIRQDIDTFNQSLVFAHR